MTKFDWNWNKTKNKKYGLLCNILFKLICIHGNSCKEQMDHNLNLWRAMIASFLTVWHTRRFELLQAGRSYVFVICWLAMATYSKDGLLLFQGIKNRQHEDVMLGFFKNTVSFYSRNVILEHWFIVFAHFVCIWDHLIEKSPWKILTC